AASDLSEAAQVLLDIATVDGVWRVHWQPAMDDVNEALSLARESGDRECEERALQSLGYTSYMFGDYEASEDYLKAELAIAHANGDCVREADTLRLLTNPFSERGDGDAVVASAEQALEITEQIGAHFTD